MRTLLDTPHYALQLDDDRRLVVFRRKPQRLTADEIDAAFAPAVSVDTIDRQRWHLLIDSRDGPMNNDEAFEKKMQLVVQKLVTGYRRRAILVKTAVGVLQVSRTSRAVDDPTVAEPGIFRDEPEAIAWLLAP